MYLQKSYLNTTVFLSGFALMTVELLGGKILAPYFGSSIYVWGSVLTVFMSALAAGYLLGGRYSRKHNTQNHLIVILLATSALLVPLFFYNEIASYWFSLINDSRYAALVTAICLYTLPTVGFGMISPVAIRLATHSCQESGYTAGRLYFFSTIGSAIGTLFTSFYWVILAEVTTILLCIITMFVMISIIGVCLSLLNPINKHRQFKQVGRVFIALFIVVLLWGWQTSHKQHGETTLLFDKTSLYQHIYVIKNDKMKCLRFRKQHKNKPDLYQSCQYLNNPDKQVFKYTKFILSASSQLKNPKSILVLGLGGGIISSALAGLYPEANITSVELDPMVVNVAKEFFGYNDSKQHIKTVISDARVFVKKSLKKSNDLYDLIILDTYNNDYIPEHLLTKEYLNEVKSLLNPMGIVVSNTFASSHVAANEQATYQAVFGTLYGAVAGKEGNRVLTTRKTQYPNTIDRQKLTKLGIDLDMFYQQFKLLPKSKSVVMTDTYSPINILK